MNGILKFGVLFILLTNMLISVILLLHLGEIAQGYSVNIFIAIGQIMTGIGSFVSIVGLAKQGEIQ